MAVQKMKVTNQSFSYIVDFSHFHIFSFLKLRIVFQSEPSTNTREPGQRPAKRRRKKPYFHIFKIWIEFYAGDFHVVVDYNSIRSDVHRNCLKQEKIEISETDFWKMEYRTTGTNSVE